MSGFKPVSGGGGLFHAEKFVWSQIISSGQTGDLVTIGEAGKIVKLTYLTTNTVSSQPGMGIEVDGNVVVLAQTLVDHTPSTDSGAFSVFKGCPSNDAYAVVGSLDEVVGEFITITKSAGNTTESIIYSYVIGTVK